MTPTPFVCCQTWEWTMAGAEAIVDTKPDHSPRECDCYCHEVWKQFRCHETAR